MILVDWINERIAELKVMMNAESKRDNPDCVLIVQCIMTINDLWGVAKRIENHYMLWGRRGDEGHCESY